MGRLWRSNGSAGHRANGRAMIGAGGLLSYSEVLSSRSSHLSQTPMSAPTSTIQCENCGTVLQGHYCHVCGQRAHNPLRHFAHAVEEVLESFWHLDGRIFRTLRDLLVPGRLAAGYLAGHRVRYIAPLRLFIILTLLTIFVANFTISFDNVAGRSPISDAQSVPEVIRLRDAALNDLRDSRVKMENEMKKSPSFAAGGYEGGIAGIDAGITAVEQEAAKRIRELESARRGISTATATSVTYAKAGKRADHNAGVKQDGFGVDIADDQDGLFLQFGNDRRWDPAKDDVAIAWLPDVVNAWATKKARLAANNYKRLETNGDRLKDAWLRALPTSLFVMVPLFALLLKLLHAFTPRTYLEHLVVALYSHAWLMLAILCIFLMTDVIAIWPSITWLSVSLGLVMGAIGIWIPIYLFIMQKRVYRQHWLLTGVKFFVIGNLYFFMLTMTILASAAIGLVQM